MTGHEFPDEAFARPTGVKVRGVDEVATRFTEGLVDCFRFLFGRAPAPVVTEGHGAEAEVGDPEAAATEELVVHGVHRISLSFDCHH